MLHLFIFTWNQQQQHNNDDDDGEMDWGTVDWDGLSIWNIRV